MNVKSIIVSFIVCSKLPCVSHLDIKYWNCLNKELKIKLADTIVGPFSFDYTGNWYFELATSTLHNCGACIYLRIHWPARTPVILLTHLYLSSLSSLPVIVFVSESGPNVSCYVMLCYVTLLYFKLRYVTLSYVMLCYVMLCYVMLCYVMLCYVMLCYVMLCYWYCCSCFVMQSSVVFEVVISTYIAVGSTAFHTGM